MSRELYLNIKSVKNLGSLWIYKHVCDLWCDTSKQILFPRRYERIKVVFFLQKSRFKFLITDQDIRNDFHRQKESNVFKTEKIKPTSKSIFQSMF